MTTLTVTSKGQMTLKKSVLSHLGVHPGDQVEVELLPSGRAEIRARKTEGSLANFIGILAGGSAPPISIEQMNDVIADGWAGLPYDHS